VWELEKVLEPDFRHLGSLNQNRCHSRCCRTPGPKWWGERDDLQLKAIFFLVVVSWLVRAFAESGIAKPRLPVGLLLFMFRMVAERYRFWIIADRYRADRRAIGDDRRSLLQVALQ
jgi:hypothetical protein